MYLSIQGVGFSNYGHTAMAGAPLRRVHQIEFEKRLHKLSHQERDDGSQYVSGVPTVHSPASYLGFRVTHQEA